MQMWGGWQPFDIAIVALGRPARFDINLAIIYRH